MRLDRRALPMLLAVLLVGAVGFQPTLAKDDKAGVQAAIDQFYAALNEMFEGNVEPMYEVWSNKDDVTYMGPLGKILVGWDAVKAAWDEQAAMELGGQVTPEHRQVVIGKDIAIAVSFERGMNTNMDGAVRAVNIRATNTFRKQGGKWKMIGHHTDMFEN